MTSANFHTPNSQLTYVINSRRPPACTKLPCLFCLFSSPPVLVDVVCEWSLTCASGHGRGHHRARCGGLLAPFPNITMCLGLGGGGGALVDAVGETLHGAGILKSIREHVHMMPALRGRGWEPHHLPDAGIVPSASELGVLQKVPHHPIVVFVVGFLESGGIHI